MFILGLVLVAKRGGLVTVDQVVGISEARGEATLYTEGLPPSSLSLSKMLQGSETALKRFRE